MLVVLALLALDLLLLLVALVLLVLLAYRGAGLLLVVARAGGRQELLLPRRAGGGGRRGGVVLRGEVERTLVVWRGACLGQEAVELLALLRGDVAAGDAGGGVGVVCQCRGRVHSLRCGAGARTYLSRSSEQRRGPLR